MIIKIKRVNNGVVLTSEEGEEVFEFDSEDLTRLHELHYELDALIEPMNGRNSRQRMTHRIVHGDKYECKGCDICKEE